MNPKPKERGCRGGSGSRATSERGSRGAASAWKVEISSLVLSLLRAVADRQTCVSSRQKYVVLQTGCSDLLECQACRDMGTVTLGLPVVPTSSSLPFEGMVGILWRRGIDGLTAVAAPSLAATLAH